MCVPSLAAEPAKRPLVSTRLIEETGNSAASAFWLAFGGASGLVATFLIYHERPVPATADGSPA